MTWQVMWEPAALDAAAGHLKGNPDDIRELLQVTDQLASNARPEGSRPWGAHHRRLRHGPWRILYRLDIDAGTLHIEHIGRTR